MSRLLSLVLTCLAVLVLAPIALAANPTDEAAPADAGSWADPQIGTVLAAGLMGPSPEEFRPNDLLTASELSEILTGLGTTAPAPPDPAATVSTADLDAALVRQLGLASIAKQYRSVLATAGLGPTKRAGTAIVAKALKLHPNHEQEQLEPVPTQPVTRAETAYSVARVLALPGSWEIGEVEAKAAAFAIPELTDWQRRVLARAVEFLGYPYVWAGSSETARPAGFDCSGFVWRVYKLEPYAEAPQLAATLVGRTTYSMSDEVDAALRIGREALQPADVVFFGDKGPRSKPAQVGHMGIYLGNGWFIHSSSGGGGVMLSTLTGYYDERFAWARRPLAEAGLS